MSWQKTGWKDVADYLDESNIKVKVNFSIGESESYLDGNDRENGC